MYHNFNDQCFGKVRSRHNQLKVTAKMVNIIRNVNKFAADMKVLL